MDEKLRFQIFTGPLEEEWLVAELFYGDEMWGELTEWGEKLILYPRQNGEPWRFSTKDAMEMLKQARQQVRPVAGDK